MRLGRPMVDRRTVPITEQISARRDEISELQLRFKLLDAQYTNDIKQLIAIEESGLSDKRFDSEKTKSATR